MAALITPDGSPPRSSRAPPASSDEQPARRLVPALQTALVEGIDATRRNVCEVKRGPAGAPNVADLGQQPEDDLGLIGPVPGLVREPGRDQRLTQNRARVGVDRVAVQSSSLAARCCEALTVDRVIHHSRGQPVRVLQGDAHSPCTESVQKVHGPVQWIDDPAPRVLPLDARALLADQPVIGALRGEQLADDPLGLAVGVRHRVGGGGLRREPLGGAAEVRHQHLAGGSRRPLGELQVGAH